MDGGARAMTCFLWMERSCLRLTGRDRKIIFSEPGILAGIRLVMDYLGRLSLVRKLLGDARRYTGFIWTRRFRLRSLCGRRLSMGTPMCGRIIIFRWLTGIRRSRMRRFLRCLGWSRGFREFIRWAGRGMRGGEKAVVSG